METAIQNSAPDASGKHEIIGKGINTSLKENFEGKRVVFFRGAQFSATPRNRNLFSETRRNDKNDSHGVAFTVGKRASSRA
jgi:hypothetical protein